MRDRLSAEAVTRGAALLLDLSQVAPWARSGQNLVWISSCTVYRGCILDRVEDLTAAFGAIRNELRISTVEGVQADFSFHQHGPQLQNGGYGHEFTLFVSRWAALAEGTRFGFGDEAKGNLVSLVLDGSRWMVRQRNFDLSARGRGISMPWTAEYATALIPVARQLAAIYPARADELKAFAEHIEGRGAPASVVGNKYFWRSDFMAQQRPDYYFSVKMCSSRTVGTELINRENLLGYWLSLGLTNILHDGDEYKGIFPVWNWAQLPGVTAPDCVPSMLKFQTNLADFVGGVSDGSIGAAAMVLQKDRLSGRKAWLLFDRAVVALGAGIGCPDDAAVLTTVNQCLLRGEVQADGQPVESGKAQPVSQWVSHDNVGYVFPDRQKAVVRAGPQTGNWRQICEMLTTDPVTKPVFSLFIEHGAKPRQAGYAYFILPSASREETAAFAEKPSLEILANTPVLQAARELRSGIAELVFYEPGTCALKDGGEVTVDTPCLLIIKPRENGAVITMATPLRTTKQVTLTLRAGAKRQTLVFPLPEGVRAGESATQEVVW
jgi:chondroitin AC lyase